VACYKEHKDSPQCATKDLVGKKAENAFQEEPTLHVPFSTDDTVPAEKLQQLGAFTYSLNQQLLIVFPRRTLPGAAQLAPQSPPALAAPTDRCGHECPVSHDGRHAGAALRRVRQCLSAGRGTHDGCRKG